MSASEPQVLSRASDGRQEPRSRRGLVGVLLAHAVALTGTRVSAIALPWFVLVTTGSPAQMGLVAFCEMAPYVVVKGLTGPMVDHLGPRRVSIVADVVSGTAMGLVPLLHLADLLPLWALLVLVAVAGAARGPGDSAKEVFVPTVAERAGVPLERATGLSGSIDRLSSTVGPAIAGVLVASIDAVNAITATAVAFAIGAVITAWAVPRDPAPDPDVALEPYGRRFAEGFRFIQRDKLLRAVLGMVAVTNLLDAAMFSVLLPLWVRSNGYGPEVIGYVGSAFGAMAVIGSLTAAALAHRMPRRITYMVGFLLAGAPRFVAMGLDLPLPAVLAVIACGGLGAGFINPVISAVFFERIPRPLLGRVNALGDAICWAGIPFGGMVGAALVATAGLGPALLALGAVYLVTTTLPGLRPEWRRMDAERAARPPG